MNPPHTIESLIAELTRIAASRGWGAQLLTNIVEVVDPSGERKVTLLNGFEEKLDELETELETEVDTANDNVRDLEREVSRLEAERNALRNAVERLTREVLTLKEAARQ